MNKIINDEFSDKNVIKDESVSGIVEDEEAKSLPSSINEEENENEQDDLSSCNCGKYSITAEGSIYKIYSTATLDKLSDRSPDNTCEEKYGSAISISDNNPICNFINDEQHMDTKCSTIDSPKADFYSGNFVKTKHNFVNKNLNNLKADNICSNSSINSCTSTSNTRNYIRHTRIIDVTSAIKDMSKKISKFHLAWDSNTRTVLIVTKIFDRENLIKCNHIARWLLLIGVRTFVEDVVCESKEFDMPGLLEFMKNNDIDSTNQENCLLKTWNYALCKKNPTLFDIIVTLGGDGTVLHAGWLFNNYCPPIVSYDLGSLGFLTAFPYNTFINSIVTLLMLDKKIVYEMIATDKISREIFIDSQIINRNIFDTIDLDKIKFKSRPQSAICSYSGTHKNNYSIIFRMRLAAVICEKEELPKILPCFNGKGKGNHTFIIQDNDSYPEQKHKCCFPFNPEVLNFKPINIINDVVIDRGPTPYVCQMEIYVDGVFLTLIRADGLVISTPTGSSAYSLSAGGSLLHPSLSAIIITPICPHTISFRPIVLPASSIIRVTIPIHSRTKCWACFDGKNRVCVNKGDSVIVSTSNESLPTVGRYDASEDWFIKIEDCLGLNRYYPKNYRFAVLEKKE